MTAVIRVDHLVKHFPVARHVTVKAVNGVSFTVEKGRTLGLVGESGSGKTTVGRCLVKLVDATAGKIFYREQEITHMSERKFRPYRSNIQMVFQEPWEALNPRMTVQQLIAEPLKLQATLPATDITARVYHLLETVGLRHDHLDARPRHLSGGAQQRVGIARAIATDPDFVVLDEPTSSLDISARGEIIRVLVKLQQELGLSYLFISHDLATVRSICDAVAIMYLGQIVEMGTKEEIFESTLHPYGRALLSSVLYPDPRRKRPQYILRGDIPSPVSLPRGCFLHSRCPEAIADCSTTRQRLADAGNGHTVACMRVNDGAAVSQDDNDPESQHAA